VARRRRKRTGARRAPRIKAFGPPLPPATLSDADWQKILDEIGPDAKPKRPVQARHRLARCLRDYRGLRRNPATLRSALRRWQRIDKLAHALDAALTDEWRHKRWRYNPLIDDALKKHLLPATESIIYALTMSVRIRKGKLDPARDFLYETLLLTVWPDYFGRTLGASNTKSGGPCVRFLRAAAALTGEVLSVVTARRIVKEAARASIATKKARGHRSKSTGIFRAPKAVTNQSPENSG
jgi:hypothetical protein